MPVWISLLCWAGILAVCVLNIRLTGSTFKGWTNLVPVYRANKPPQSGFRVTSYRSSFMYWVFPKLNKRAMLTDRGIYLQANPLLLRVSYPALLLPWHHFERAATYKSGATPLVLLHFKDAEGRQMDVSLPARAIPTIRRLSGWDDL